MGAPLRSVEDGQASIDGLFGNFTDIAGKELRRHASLLNYWLSIRGDRRYPAIRDLDPLELSDAGPSSVLLELTGAGEDAEIRHLGPAIRPRNPVERVSEAPSDSILAQLAARLPAVARSGQPAAFEDDLQTADGRVRYWATLLPFSTAGIYVDYVYGLVSIDSQAGDGSDAVGDEAEPESQGIEVSASPADDQAQTVEDLPELRDADECQGSGADTDAELDATKFDPLEKVRSFFGTTAESRPHIVEPGDVPATTDANHPVEEAASDRFDQDGEDASAFLDPEPQDEPECDPVEIEESEPGQAGEASLPSPGEEENSGQPDVIEESGEALLQDSLALARSKADEARLALLRSEQALLEGLSAAYDFALDAEQRPEQYLKMVEDQGIKIQLRSPMAPVVKLAFDGLCDEQIIAQFEAVMAWALREDLPRGSLAERVAAEGGIGAIVEDQARNG